MATAAKVEFDIHPDMKDLIDAKLAVPQTQSPNEMRAGWNNYGATLSRPYPTGMVVGDTYLSCPGAGTNGRIPVRVYRPRGVKEPSPCAVYLHGGAFIKGSLDSGDTVAWGIADQVGSIGVSIDYRLAPEHPFPAGVEDCYAVVSHLAKHGAAYGIDGTRIALWGDSAGGNMTAATCLMARDRGGPKIVAQAIVYGCLTDDLSAESYRRYADTLVPTASIDRAWNAYLGKGRPTTNGYAAPLKAADLSNLPPALVHYAEFDCLADDSRQYAARLKEAGNEATLRCAERMIHGFTRARFSGPAAAAEYAATCAFLKRHLRL
jgi:acetyl esterase